MCVVSMVMDHYREKWEPYVQPEFPFTPTSPIINPQVFPLPQPTITPEEVAEFKRLLERAREYDRRNNEPDCELDEKRQILKKIAKQLGVDISFL